MPIIIITKKFIYESKLHILRLDAYTRTALVLAGAFGAYSLVANNIANVENKALNLQNIVSEKEQVKNELKEVF